MMMKDDTHANEPLMGPHSHHPDKGSHHDSSSQSKQGGWGIFLLMSALVSLPAWYAYHRVYWVPTPRLVDTPPDKFAEQRAFRHVQDLATGIGNRQVSTPGLQLATRYMLAQVKTIQSEAAPRQDLDVQVDLETVSGAVAMSFTGINFTNAYRHLDNVVLKITPTAAKDVPAVLIVSHYDSGVCSRGAADDASQAAVMLETARTLVHKRDQLPAAPIIFLWTGGEEAISPAANGWARSSKHYKEAGAFINLESLGGGGVPIVFQHTGSWVLQAFAHGVPNPRGSRIPQDIFDLNLIPADSDFRMFSARHYGSLPGLDVAFLFDSSAYHTYQDIPERFRPGILQEMGDALIGGSYSVAQQLAQRSSKSGEQKQQSAVERSVFFDVLGFFVVEYSDSSATLIHNVPLLLFLLWPLVLTFTEGRPLDSSYMRLLASSVRALVTFVLAIAFPVALAVLRVKLTGKPMVFYAHQWLAPAMFLPASLAGVLLPWHEIRQRARRNDPSRKGSYVACQIHGCGVAGSIIGSCLTALGIMGAACFFSLLSLTAFVLGLILQGPQVSGKHILWALAVAALPAAVSTSSVGVFVLVLMERMNMSGAGLTILADIIVAVMHSATLLTMLSGALVPLLAYTIPGAHKRLTAGLLGFSLLMALGSSLVCQPYSQHQPKRVILNHFVFTEADPSVPQAPSGQPVAMRTVNESIALAGTDSTPLEKAIDVSRFTPAPATGREHDVVFPLSSLLQGFTARVPQTPHAPSPSATASASPSSSSSSSSSSGDSSGDSSAGTGSFWGGSSIFSVRDAGKKDSAGAATDVEGASVRAVPTGSDAPAPATRVISLTPWSAWLETQQQLHREQLQVEAERQEQAGGRARLPFLQVMQVEQLACGAPGTSDPGCRPSGSGEQATKARVHMRMYSAHHFWGVLNVTGPLMDWSFTPDLVAVYAARKPGTVADWKPHIIRLTSQDPDPSWPFWVDVDLTAVEAQKQRSGNKAAPSLGLHLELSIVDLTRTEVLDGVMAMLPSYMAETWLATVHHSQWDF